MGQIASTNLDHGLSAAKGWFEMAALDFQAAIDPAVTFTVPDGRVMQLYTAGRYPINCTVKTGLSNTSMPLFLWHGNNSYDVSNNGIIASNGRWDFQAIGPTGIAQMLVGKGAYELESTEFDTTKSYAPNQLLTAVQADTTAATGGLITNVGTAAGGTKVKQYTDTVCGVVSRGVFTNQDGVSVLAFWPEWLPGTPN
jgi:hypothetical protein